MEYEADGKSAAIAGQAASISALCKLEILSERLNAYTGFVQNIFDAKKLIPTTFWDGYRQFLTLTEDFDGIHIDETVTATGKLSNTPGSRVRLKNPWISHPLLEQRIDNIRSLICTEVNRNHDNIQDIVTTKVYAESSRLLYAYAGYDSAKICSGADYRELLATELDENSFPLAMRPFFNRELCGFKVDNDEVDYFSKTTEEVFSEANIRAVESYTTAISDYRTMMMFKDKQTSEKRIQYDGAVYTRKNVPVERQLEIIKGLEPRVIAIETEVCLLALSKTNDRELISKAFDDIFYSQKVIRYIAENILPERNAAHRQIGEGGEMDQKAFHQLQQRLLAFKAAMRQTIEDIEVERLYPVMHVEMAKSLKRIEDAGLLTGSSIGGEEVQYLFSLPDYIITQFRSLAYYSKKIISDTIEGKTPLMYWNNSVASRTAETTV